MRPTCCSLYPWPGNVRELDNVMQRALILANGPVIQAEHMHLEIEGLDACRALRRQSRGARARCRVRRLLLRRRRMAAGSAEQSRRLSDSLSTAERDLILEALRSDNGNRQAVAKRLGISPRTLALQAATLREAGVASRSPEVSTHVIIADRRRAFADPLHAVADRRRRRAAERRRQARRASAGAVQAPTNSFANVLKQGLEQVNQAQAARRGPRDAVRAGRAGRRAAAGHAGNAEGQCVVPRDHRSAQPLRECVPGDHEHADLRSD